VLSSSIYRHRRSSQIINALSAFQDTLVHLPRIAQSPHMTGLPWACGCKVADGGERSTRHDATVILFWRNTGGCLAEERKSSSAGESFI
jgi:hypothetical protein